MVSESLLKVIIFNGGIHKHEIKKQNWQYNVQGLDIKFV